MLGGANPKARGTEGENDVAWLPEETVGHPANTETAGPFALPTVNRKRDRPDKLELASMNAAAKTPSFGHLLVPHHQPQVPLFGGNTRIATATSIRLLDIVS